MRYPEIVKTNARYRGPMESRKVRSGVLDVQASLNILRQQLSHNNERGGSLRSKMHDHYIEDVPNDRKGFVTTILAVRGGEM